MVATLFEESGADRSHGLTGHYPVQIYARRASGRSDLIKVLEDWGRRSVSGKAPYPGLPREVFSGARLLSSQPHSRVWRAVTLP